MSINSGGMSLRELSRLSGVAPSQLSRFMSGPQDIGLESADKICAVLGLELIQNRPPELPKPRGEG
jgi:transcriptional regulator with XRE-family HTH domain